MGLTMWDKLKRNWLFWVFTIGFIASIFYTVSKWEPNPENIFHNVFASLPILVTAIADSLTIISLLSKQEENPQEINNSNNQTVNKENIQKGRENIQIGEVGREGSLIIDQSNKSETRNYYTSMDANKINFDDTYMPPTPPPSNQLPDIAPLPPGSYLPFVEDRNFTGREADLLWIANNLLYSQQSNPAVVVHGIGGMGKSHLAIRYCQLYGQFYKGVHWINAKEDLNLGIASCGEKMSVEPWPDELPDQVQYTKKAWGKSSPRLVVLDDVKDPTHLKNLLKEIPKIHILATSRCKTWPTGLPVEDHGLDQMSSEEARIFLRRLSPRFCKTNDEILNKLSKTLGWLPLALYLAGCYLRDRNDLSVSSYLQHISEVENLLNEREFNDWTELSLSEHPNSLMATFEISWQMLDEKPDADIAKYIFLVCGYCVPGIPIPQEFINFLTTEDWNEADIASGIRLLMSVGLVESSGSDILIHPLLAGFANYKDSDGENKPKVAKAYGDFSYQLINAGDPKEFSKHFPHLHHVAVIAEEELIDDAGRLWNHLGVLNESLANFDAAKANIEKALAIDIQFYGEEHPTVATDLSNLGGVLRALGDLPGAKANYEKALALDIQFYGEEHPDVATLLGNLGSVLRALGDLPGAKAIYEKALALAIQFFSEEHPEVARNLNNLGRVLKDLGDLPGAKANFEKALALVTQFYGEEHPTVATLLSNLGVVLQDLGDLPGAKANLEKALALDIQFYGEEHPEVATRLSNLGGVLRALGDLPGAKANYERALTVLKDKLPPDHPNIRIVQGNLDRLNQQIQSHGKAK
jgi:tetratricopeptide (TPR) repeat protein